MKKFLNILCLALFASFATLPLCAQSEDEGIVEVDQSVGTSSSAKAYLVDDAILLSSPQAQALEQKLGAISERYDCDVVVVTKTNISGSNVTGYADDFFDGNGYGRGSDNNGILFLITMEEREWAISTCGHDAITIFSDWRQEQITGKMMPFLKAGDYAGAFDAFAQSCEYYLSRGVPSEETLSGEDGIVSGQGHSAGADTEKGPLDPVWAGISALIGLISSWLGSSAKRSKYRTVVERTTASGYEKLAGASGNNADRFIRTQTSRTLRPTETASRTSFSGGYSHSSTHTSSSGHTHGGSHGSF